MCFITSMG